VHVITYNTTFFSRTEQTLNANLHAPQPNIFLWSFRNQLEMFHTLVTTTADVSPHATGTLDKCTSILRNMAPPMRAMFPLVEALVRLLLVNPASSATAERSFSSLRRLKTYLRSTCGQRRLNNLAFLIFTRTSWTASMSMS
jgi:hypothetical protein